MVEARAVRAGDAGGVGKLRLGELCVDNVGVLVPVVNADPHLDKC